jgi:hypothetical protein
MKKKKGGCHFHDNPFDIPSINFYYQIPDSDEIEMNPVEYVIESIDLELWLGVC